MGQSSSSLVLSVIKTEFLWIMITLLAKIFYCKKYGERIEKQSQQNKLSKFCMDAGFLNVVEIGQYFRTKDTAEFSQFTDAVACREYTLPRDEEASQPKGWIQGKTKIGPALEVAICYLHGQYGVEIRIWSMNRRILQADQRPKQNHKDENLAVLPQEQFLLGQEFGPMLSQGNFHSPIVLHRRNWFIFFVMETNYIEKMMEQLNSGELKIVFIGLTKSGRKDFSIVPILQEKCFASELFKVIQDAVLLMLLYRTMLLFRTTSSSTFIMSDVQSICILSSVRD